MRRGMWETIMDPSAFDDLLNTLRATSATITAVLLVAFFTTLAVILWVWRGIALKDEEQ